MFLGTFPNDLINRFVWDQWTAAVCNSSGFFGLCLETLVFDRGDLMGIGLFGGYDQADDAADDEGGDSGDCDDGGVHKKSPFARCDINI